MKILFLILEKDVNKKLSKKTHNSITSNGSKDDVLEIKLVHDVDKDNLQLYYNVLKDISDSYDFICLLPNESIIKNNYIKIVKEYIHEHDGEKEDIVYLPFVLLNTDKANGILNSTLFNANFTDLFGRATHEFVLQQTDTILFGALIPLKLLRDDKYYDNELKMYQHFHLLNAWTKNEDEIKVIGIPKLIVELNHDLSFDEYSEEDKVKYYKQARESFIVELNKEKEDRVERIEAIK